MRLPLDHLFHSRHFCLNEIHRQTAFGSGKMFRRPFFFCQRSNLGRTPIRCYSRHEVAFSLPFEALGMFGNDKPKTTTTKP
jgi:hypothetical protein